MNITLPDWLGEIACAAADPETFFPPVPGNPNPALRICAGCPVRQQCLDLAMDAEGSGPRAYRHGIFGGMTATQRQALYVHRLAIQAESQQIGA